MNNYHEAHPENITLLEDDADQIEVREHEEQRGHETNKTAWTRKVMELDLDVTGDLQQAGDMALLNRSIPDYHGQGLQEREGEG